jgi:glycosyltransferase involved in cell wall biosynthesis
MKILIVIPYLSSTYGGTSKIAKELAEGLGKTGISVDIVTTNANGEHQLDVSLNEWINEKFYRVQYFSCWHRKDFVVSFPLVKWLTTHIKDYDLVHTNTIFSPVVLLTHWICKIHKTAYIMAPHGMLEPWAISNKAWKKRPYYSFLEKPMLQTASAIHVTSSTEASNTSSFAFKSPLIHISNGIHRYEFESLPDADIFYQYFPETCNKTLLLFLGRIDPKKGLDLLAPAFAKVHTQFPQTHLVVAGPDNTGFLATAQSYFAQAGCLEAVTFTGMLTGELKHAALAAADLYVAPSYSEGFSMSVLEGMASGLPCVITTGCNFPEAADAGVAHVVDINADAIADALVQCLSDPQQAKQMGDRAREFIFQHYTWEQSAKKLLQVYKAILEKKPIPKDLSNTQINPVAYP